MKRETLLKISVGIFTLVLIIILLSQVSIKEIINTLLSINPLYLIIGFILYFCTYILRALRFHFLLNKTISLRRLLPITCVHIMMNILLPARTGELSYVYLVKKIHSKTTGEGIATLIVARVFDFIVIIFLLFAAGLFIRDIPKFVMDFLWIIYIFLFCIVILLIAVVFFGHRFIKVMKQTFEHLYWDKSKYGNYILQKGNELVISFDTVGVRRNVFLVGILSLSIWLISFVTLYLILVGMGISLPIPNVIMGSTFILLTSVLPIHGIGGFGTTEAIWTLVYIPLGMTTNDAIISGFGYHLIILLFASILGLSGFLFLNRGTPDTSP